MFYTGVVENRSDPLQLGRCQVRIVGLHTHDKSKLPTEQLPWSTPVQPIGSAAMNGIGMTPVGPVEGSTVIIMFADESKQQPIMLGTVGGIPQTPVSITDDDSDEAIVESKETKDITLRTIDGPVTGYKLTFIDKQSGKTDLTKDLKANMKVLGFNLSTNCFIVTINSGTEITISEQVAGYGENIISFKPAPSNLDAVNQSKASGNLVDSSGQPVLDSSGKPVKSGTEPASATAPAQPAATNTNVSIPTVPPPKSTSSASKASDGIKALIAACDKVGLTTKEQKCALLGIAGGESTWIPQNEAFNYSAPRLKQIFSFATEDDVSKYSDAVKKGITRAEFFSWCYGPTKRGKGFFGHKTDADGGKYYGRGFIQLTGYSNYKRYNDMANKLGLGIDIVNDPDSLDTDINTSALIAALYIKDRVPKGTNTTAHPDYFYAAKKSVGVNSPDISARKLKYYEYFYGSGATGGVEKDAGTVAPEPPKDNSPPTPGPSDDSIKRGTDNTGFRDPNNKYPLKDYINEPDTNRLARGIIEGTVVQKKDSNVRTGVPKAIDTGSWDQPLPVYGAKYPFNKVLETESGHIQEFDDSPGYERIHTYHRSGTYSEIDPQGTQVNFIVGDSFTLMERNGCLHVSGECNITVDGNVNLLARSDANIEVSNNANIRVGNNVDLGIANDMNVAIGGDFKLKVAGSFDIAADNMTVKSANNLFFQGAQGTSIKSNSVQIESAEDMNILAGGTLNADYATGQFGNGASGAQDIEDFTLVAPDPGAPLDPVVPYLIPPERQIEEKAAAETPEDYNTPEGRANSAKQQREGVPVPPPTVPTEDAGAPTGSVAAKEIPVDCKIIYNTTNFTNDYRLSQNFTLGMMMDGGVGGRHKLVDQILASGDDRNVTRVYTVQEIVCNLAQLAQNVLEPALAVLPGGIGGYNKQWKINSGYRLKGVVPNESPTSDHCKGRACDIGILLPDKNRKTYELSQQLEKALPYDQIILEYRAPTSCWIHISYRSQGTRKMAFTMVNDSTYKRNSKGIPEGFVLVENPVPPKGQKA